MTVASLGLNFTDAAIIVGVSVFVLTKLAEMRGWLPSSALIRQENADLRERNATLEQEVHRLSEADRDKGNKLAALEALVHELKQRDQAAVLTAIAAHDASMVKLGETLASLSQTHEQRAEQRAGQWTAQHIEAMAVWGQIRDAVAGE